MAQIVAEEKKPEKREKKGPGVKEKMSGQVIRILGTDIRGEMKVVPGIAVIKGIGINMSSAMVNKLGLSRKKRMQDLNDDEIDRIEKAIANPESLGIPQWMFNRRKDLDTGKNLHLHTVDLIFAQKADIDLMGEIKSYKGLRHAKGLKVRGQRTASTGRGRNAVGVQRKKNVQGAAAAVKEDKKK
jgi:small subunit ribosomal protein S13